MRWWDLGTTTGPFSISQAYGRTLHHFDHDATKLLGLWGEGSIPGWEGNEKELCLPLRTLMQPLVFLWIFYCVPSAFGLWLTIPWARNGLCSCSWDMAFLVG